MGLEGRAGAACNLWTPALAKTPAYLAETWHLTVMVALLLAQAVFHFPEHVAQFLQVFYLKVPANGVLGQLNIEWVHFLYNLGILALMLPIVIGCGFFAPGNAWKRYNKVAWALMVFAFAVAVWHLPEHYAKLAQYYHNLALTPPVVPAGGPNAPGLIGQGLLNVFGPPGVVVFHWTLNILEMIPIVYAFLAYDVPGALRARLRGERPLPAGAA
jgi:hypothetical protein